MRAEDLETQMLSLPHRERARLAERLLTSLDALSPEENDTLWAEEVERRAASWTAADSARTSDVVFRSVRKRVR